MAEHVCTVREHQIVDALFGELDAAGMEDLQKHMQTCSGCADAFQQMQQTLTITSQVPEPELPAAYWDTYFDRLQDRMADTVHPHLVQQWWLRFKGWLQHALLPQSAFIRPAFIQWGGAIALVLLGVFIGRQWDSQPVEAPAEQLLAESTTNEITPIQLSEKTHQYLDRSKVLLLGLVNFDLNEDDPAIINLAQQQEVAGELVAEAALLKQELTQNREQQLSTLVEELELILLQIANLEMQEDIPSIELIQRGVDQGSLLLKINLEKMKLSEQRAPAGSNNKVAGDVLVF